MLLPLVMTLIERDPLLRRECRRLGRGGLRGPSFRERVREDGGAVEIGVGGDGDGDGWGWGWGWGWVGSLWLHDCVGGGF